MSTSGPLTYRTEEDLNRVEVDRIRPEYRQRFRRVYPQIDKWASEGFWRNQVDCNSEAGLDFLEAAATIYNIYTTLDKPPQRLVHSVAETARCIVNKSSLDIFCRISPAAQEYFMKISTRVSRPITHTYLSLLEQTGVVPKRFLDENENPLTNAWSPVESWDESADKIPLLANWCKDIAGTNPISVTGKTLDFTYPSSEFVDLIISYARPKHDLYQCEKTLLMLLRALYSEDMVLEVCQRFKDQEILLSVRELNQVLSNWDEYREHPTSWIAEISGLSHSVQ